MSTDQYCKINGGEVIEWGITLEHIKNRKHSLSNYSKIMSSPIPAILEYQYLHEGKPVLISGVPYETYIINTLSLDKYKELRISKLSDLLKTYISGRPRIDSSLGFFVDGSKDDLNNFKIGKDLGLTTVRDADNITQTIQIADWDTIIAAVSTYGLSAYQEKWAREDEIKAIIVDVGTTEPEALELVRNVDFSYFM